MIRKSTMSVRGTFPDSVGPPLFPPAGSFEDPRPHAWSMCAAYWEIQEQEHAAHMRPGILAARGSSQLRCHVPTAAHEQSLLEGVLAVLAGVRALVAMRCQQCMPMWVSRT